MGWFSKKKETKAPEKGVGKMNVIIPDNVKETIAQRGIKPEDATAVIETAEATKRKLASKDGTRYIAKKIMGDVTVYADYSMAGGSATLNSAYSHRMVMGEVMNATHDSEWTCADCGGIAKEGHVKMTYMTVERLGPAVICPNCSDAWAEEYLAALTLAAVEGLFEKKRA